MYVDLQRFSDTVSVGTATTLTPMPSARSRRPVILAATTLHDSQRRLPPPSGGQSGFTPKTSTSIKTAWLRPAAMGWDVGSCSGPRSDELRSMFTDFEWS